MSLTTKELKVKGWRSDYHYEWITTNYEQRYYEDIVAICKQLSFEEFQFFYDNLRPLNSNLYGQVERYSNVIDQLGAIEGMQFHQKNIQKIVDDLNLRI